MKREKKVAFDLYSMKQAIEEGFILDVLQNYVTYKTYFEINKAIEDDPELETIAAKRKIAKYIELHDTNIAQKVEIIIEHFKNRIMQELGGKAKAWSLLRHGRQQSNTGTSLKPIFPSMGIRVFVHWWRFRARFLWTATNTPKR